MRASPLLALALSPPVTCTSPLLTGPTSPLASSVPRHREELGMQWQLVPQSCEDVAPEGLVPPRPALPEGPEAGGAGGAGIRQAGPFTSSSAFRGSSGDGAGGDWPGRSTLGVQPHSAGPGRPQPEAPTRPCSCGVLPSQKGEEGPILWAVCDTRHRGDCAFGLITHSFYAERRLNEGKKQQQ